MSGWFFSRSFLCVEKICLWIQIQTIQLQLCFKLQIIIYKHNSVDCPSTAFPPSLSFLFIVSPPFLSQSYYFHFLFTLCFLHFTITFFRFFSFSPSLRRDLEVVSDWKYRKMHWLLQNDELFGEWKHIWWYRCCIPCGKREKR